MLLDIYRQYRRLEKSSVFIIPFQQRDLSETSNTYIVVQPTGATIEPETIVTGAPPFIEPIKSLIGTR